MIAQPTWAARLIKLVLFVVLFYVLLSLIIMIGSADTGPIERAVLVAVAAGAFSLALPLHRIGRHRP